MNIIIIVNILNIFYNLRSCGYGHAVITGNSDIACDATLQRKILGATGDFKWDLQLKDYFQYFVLF